MKTANVSFGKVFVVYGKNNKIKKINDALRDKAYKGEIVMKDITETFWNRPNDGLLSRAAKQGDTIEMYITGDDVNKINVDPKWKTIDGIFSHLSSYIDLAKSSLSDVIDRIKRG